MPEPAIIWDRSVPPDARASVEPYLTLVICLVPTWVHEITVFWDDSGNGDESAALSVFSQMEYRHSKLSIHPLWFGETEATRRRLILHEILHLALEPLDDLVFTMIEPLKETNAELHAVRREQRRHAVESATCDLTRAIGAIRHAQPGELG